MNSQTSPQIIEHLSTSVAFTPFETIWIPSSAKFMAVGESPRRQGIISIYDFDTDEKGNEPKLKETKKITVSHGIKCATFNCCTNNNRHLTTGDFDGNLCIWDITKFTEPIYKVKAHTSVINCVDGISGSKLGAPELVTGSRDGHVKIWDPRSKESVCEMQPATKENVRDCWSVAFGNSYDEKHRNVAAGYDNGDIKLLDLRTNKIYFETNVNNGVVCVQFDRQNIKQNKLVVTTLESRFRIYEMKYKHKIEGYSYLSQMAHGSTIWQVRHLPQNRDLWCTCGGNGTVNLWKYTYPSQRFIKDELGQKKGIMGECEILAEKKLATQPIVSWDWNKDQIGLACMAALDQSVKVIFTTKLNKL